ncbi:transposable element Tcb2 transposase [Trichonephila clavipes]|nr:transposable element Tcb2 transposase [Trichonephila clavipes]
MTDNLFSMVVNDRTASSCPLASHWSTVTGVLMLASLIRRRLLSRGLTWLANWHLVVFSDESSFNLWDHDDRIRIRRYTGVRCLPKCVIERQRGITPGVMVWDAVSYHGRSNLLRIETYYMQLLPCPAYSLDMSPVKHVWDLVGQFFAHGPRPAASKNKFFLRIQAMWNSPPLAADIQNLFESMPRRVAAFIAARSGYTKY